MTAIIQVWSAPSCQSGAVCFGALAPWIAAAGSEAAGTPAGFRVTVTRDVADAAGLAEGRCLRVLSQSRGEQWWFVSSVSDSDGDAGVVQVTAGPLRQLLTVRGLVRSGSTFAFTTGKQTVAALLNAYVLTNLAADGLAWLSLGTVDFTDGVEIGDVNRVTRAAILDAIEGQTGHTARLRGLYTAGVLTGFALDVVADIAAGTETVPLTTGAGLSSVQRTRDALRAATVAVPFSSGGEPMEPTAWVVDSTVGTSPAWVLLRDPAGGNPWPIREDDQVVGAFLQQANGTFSEILDSRASDSAVQVAAVGTIVAGDVVAITRDTSGRPVLELTSPSGLTGSRGRLVATVSTRVTDRRRNLARNGTFQNWVNTNQATNWSPAGTSSANVRASRYPKNANTTNTTAAFSGTLAVSLTASVPITVLQYQGATPGMIVVAGETLRVAEDTGQPFSVTMQLTAGIHVVDNSGAGSVPITSFNPAVSYSAGRPIRMQINRRPNAFPDDGITQDAVAFLTGTANSAPPVASNARLQSAPTLVKFVTGLATVRAAVGLTHTSNVTAGVVRAAIAIVDTVTGAPNGTLLAIGNSGANFASAGTIHEIVTCSATIAADRTVALALYNDTTNNTAMFIRWASLWLDTGTTANAMTARDGSGSNLLWHRAQDVLTSQAQGTRYTVRGVDLARLVQENGALALGQSVRLRSDVLGIDATVRIVKIDYDFAQTETLSLELGAITPRLTGVTVTL